MAEAGEVSLLPVADAHADSPEALRNDRAAAQPIGAQAGRRPRPRRAGWAPASVGCAARRQARTEARARPAGETSQKAPERNRIAGQRITPGKAAEVRRQGREALDRLAALRRKRRAGSRVRQVTAFHRAAKFH